MKRSFHNLSDIMIVVPASLRTLIKHSLFCFNKIYGVANKYFYSEDTRIGIRNYVENCVVCMKSKADNQPPKDGTNTVHVNNIR